MPGRADELLADLGARRRVQVLERLGEGSVGIVDRVFDERLGRVVARKALRRELLGDERAVRTFVGEARILGQLDHGGVLPIFELELDEAGVPFYTMPEVSGPSLAELLGIDPATGRAEPLALHRTLSILRQLGDALAHAHARGVVHLDLKPQNVIVLDHDRVVLVDWGTARIHDPERLRSRFEDRPELERFLREEQQGLREAADDDVVVGTPRYMSPEQTLARRSELGPESDVFSLGVIAYQMLTGRLPFEARRLEDLLDEIRRAAPRSPREIDRGIHPRLEDIVMRMLARREWDRFERMDEMLAALDAFRSTAAEFPLRQLEAGELLFREGDEGDFAGVVVSGELEIWTEREGERRVLGRVIEGESIGELALLSDGTRSASVTALAPTTLRVIAAPALHAEVEKLSPWTLAILSDVVERFIDRSDRLVELLRSGGAGPAEED